MNCEECDTWIERKHHAQKYCVDCKPVVERRKANELQNAKYDPEKRRELYLRRRERELEYARLQRERNPDYHREWRVKNPLAHASHEAKRRAQKYTTQVEDIDIEFVYERDSGICWICEHSVDKANVHLEHIIPLSRGGSHTHDNVSVSHPVCNLRKGSLLPEEMTNTALERNELKSVL